MSATAPSGIQRADSAASRRGTGILPVIPSGTGLPPVFRGLRLLLAATALAAPATLLAQLGGAMDALDPAGPQAAHIGRLWQVLLWGSVGAFVVVMAALILAVVKHHPAPDTHDLPEPVRRRVVRAISVAAGLTVAVLTWFMAETLLAEHRLRHIQTPESADHVTIVVTGRQWWWEIEYTGARASETVTTANEIHVPVGRPVHLRLLSADVIHSFWIPSLHGKRDLIPGRENHLWIQADREGVFEGQCAEFCGLQHAHMRLLVIAQPEDEFRAWLAAQRRPAAEPATDSQRRGREVFLNTTCVMCHTVRGTSAGSRAGPELTHLASRRTLGAATLPNTRGHLAGWILDPQGIKPGNHMPPHALPAEDLHPLLDYLESLK